MSLFEINQDSGQEENYAILSGDQPVIPSISDAATDEFYYSIKKRVYLAARDGFELLIPSLLNTIPSEEVRNVLVNQVGTSAVEVSPISGITGNHRFMHKILIVHANWS